MQGWVDLGGGYNSQDSLAAKGVSEINNQAVSWPGGEPSTASRESDVLTTRPPNHTYDLLLYNMALAALTIESNSKWLHGQSAVTCEAANDVLYIRWVRV